MVSGRAGGYHDNRHGHHQQNMSALRPDQECRECSHQGKRGNPPAAPIHPAARADGEEHRACDEKPPIGCEAGSALQMPHPLAEAVPLGEQRGIRCSLGPRQLPEEIQRAGLGGDEGRERAAGSVRPRHIERMEPRCNAHEERTAPNHDGNPEGMEACAPTGCRKAHKADPCPHQSVLTEEGCESRHENHQRSIAAVCSGPVDANQSEGQQESGSRRGGIGLELEAPAGDVGNHQQADRDRDCRAGRCTETACQSMSGQEQQGQACGRDQGACGHGRSPRPHQERQECRIQGRYQGGGAREEIAGGQAPEWCIGAQGSPHTEQRARRKDQSCAAEPRQDEALDGGPGGGGGRTAQGCIACESWNCVVVQCAVAGAGAGHNDLTAQGCALRSVWRH